MRLQNLDLNLLCALQALLDEQHVARAAERLGMSQPGMSDALRRHFNDEPFQPVHQVVIPNLGLLIGEIWDLDLLAEDCAADGRYEFFLAAAPIPFYGAVGAPVNPVAVK